MLRRALRREAVQELRELEPGGPVAPGHPGDMLVDAGADDGREVTRDVRGREPLDRREVLLDADPAVGNAGPQAERE